MAEASAVVGVDIGGTFTDVVLASPGSPLLTGKYLTTADVATAVTTGIADLLERGGVRAAQVGRVVHATTLATNTILEGRGVDVAFITTRGFRELLSLGRQARVEEERYDLMADGAQLPIPLSRCFEVTERVMAGGEVLVPLDEEEASRVARRVAALGVRAVAICFLHSFANPDHEERMAQLCRRQLAAAGVAEPVVAVSHDIWPELREYERATTTLMSAYVGPVMAGYLMDLRKRLMGLGISAPLHIMDSSGGVMAAERAAAIAVRTIESGPAAGVVAARQVGLSAGCTDLLAFDMGGTTAKAGIVRSGRVGLTRDFQVGGKGSFGGRRAGSGVPIRVPAVDIAEVGSGGGSIAWVDDAGALHVGPRSAGSRPGPACYGLGGDSPTVSDADLVLGYLDPDGFAGASLQLHRDLAERAVDSLAGRLGTDRLHAAHAIVDIADAAMGFAVHVVTVQRGIDPRRFTMVASGGAGPLHAARIAERFGITTVLVPHASGVGSAVGLLDCDLTAERSQTLSRPLLLSEAPARAGELAEVFAAVEAAARKDLSEDALPASQPPMLEREADLRYRGQAFELTVPLGGGSPDGATFEQAATSFHDAYAAAYGSHVEGPIELVSLRARLTRLVPRVPRSERRAAGEPLLGTRPVCLNAPDGHVQVPVYRRDCLPSGPTLAGPVIVADTGSTTLVPSGWAAAVDPSRVLRLVRGG